MKRAVKKPQLTFDKVPVFAGRLLSGSLQFLLTDVTNIKSIILTFEGHSKTKWPGDNASSAEQWFFRVEMPCSSYLFQYSLGPGAMGKYKVPPGLHKVPFGFPIPPYSPSSFGGRFGYVFYSCKAKIVTCASIGQSEFRCEKPIAVIGHEDLNWHPQAALPLSWHEEYRRRVCLFTKADYTAVLRLPRSGFVPGEKIPVTVEVVNKHKRCKVLKVAVQLLQTIYYRCGQSEKIGRSVITEWSKGEVAPDSVLILEDEPLEIPALPPSFLRGCDNITVHYDLMFTVEPGLKLRTPITIGTVPFDANSLNKNVQALPWNKPIVPPKPTKMQQPMFAPPPPPPYSVRPPPPMFAHRRPTVHGMRPMPPPPLFAASRRYMAGRRHSNYDDDDTPVLKIEEIE